MAVGNVIGSNLFNLLGILGLSATLSPLADGAVGRFDLWVMAGFALVMLPLLWTGRRRQRWEGAPLICGYAAYLWVQWPA